ncbi:MAG: hypothetical protein ABIQ16_18775 [Polyangiaceae bacterium]
MQLDMVFEIPPVDDAPSERATITQRFEKFRAEHPEVMAYVRKLALDGVRAGREQLGIAQLWEVARWNLWSAARDNGYKLNNDFRAPAARWLMSVEVELAGVFETRKRTSEDD